MTLRVIVVDDHEVARAGIASALERAGLDVVGQAASGCEAEALARNCTPDVAIVDMRFPDSDGIEVARRIMRASSQTRVLFVTAHEGEVSSRLLDAISGHGLLLKSASLRELVKGVELAARGVAVLDPAVAAKLMKGTASQAANDPLGTLTEREREVFSLLRMGHTDSEIATDLSISKRTVKNHVARILKKLGLRRRTEIPAYAVSSLPFRQ